MNIPKKAVIVTMLLVITMMCIGSVMAQKAYNGNEYGDILRDGSCSDCNQEPDRIRDCECSNPDCNPIGDEYKNQNRFGSSLP